MQDMMSKKSRLSRSTLGAALLFVLLTAPANIAQATEVTSFTAAYNQSGSTQIISVSGGVKQSLPTNPNLLLGTSVDGKSSVWEAQISAGVSGLLLHTANGSVTLLPNDLMNPDNTLLPTTSGVVIQQENTFSYLSATAATSGAAPVDLGTVPDATDGFDRQVTALAAVDGAIYAATIDYEAGQTDSALGVSHVWYLNGASSPADSYSTTGTYIDSLAINPNSATTGQIILVDLKPTEATNASVSISISNDHKFTLTSNPTPTSVATDVLDTYLVWGVTNGSPTSLTAQVTANSTSVYAANGPFVVSFPANVNVSIVSTTSALDISASLANKLSSIASLSAPLAKSYKYNAKIKATATSSHSGFGYAVAGGAPTILLTSGKTSTALLAGGANVKVNFCLTLSAPATTILAPINQQTCSTVSNLLTVTAKKRVVSIVTSGTAITVEKQSVKKKKVTWAKFKIKIKVAKGKATVKFKSGGIYRFTAAATKTNAVAVSSNITIK